MPVVTWQLPRKEHLLQHRETYNTWQRVPIDPSAYMLTYRHPLLRRVPTTQCNVGLSRRRVIISHVTVDHMPHGMAVTARQHHTGQLGLSCQLTA